MRFLADMGVSMRVVEWLRASGHDAIHLRDEGLQKLPNSEIVQKAIREGRIVLTFAANDSQHSVNSLPTAGEGIMIRSRRP